MIKSDIVKIKNTKNFSDIEQEIFSRYKSVVRWAVVDIKDVVSVSVSYETKD